MGNGFRHGEIRRNFSMEKFGVIFPTIALSNMSVLGLSPLDKGDHHDRKIR
jgi:hypothetical protein